LISKIWTVQLLKEVLEKASLYSSITVFEESSAVYIGGRRWWSNKVLSPI